MHPDTNRHVIAHRTQERLQELGFPTVPQVRLSLEDFEEDPMEACERWQAAMDAQMEARVREAEEALLAQSREALRVTRSPFSTEGSLPSFVATPLPAALSPVAALHLGASESRHQ